MNGFELKYTENAYVFPIIYTVSVYVSTVICPVIYHVSWINSMLHICIVKPGYHILYMFAEMYSLKGSRLNLSMFGVF